jgi:hypothetical protein
MMLRLAARIVAGAVFIARESAAAFGADLPQYDSDAATLAQKL